MSRKIGFIILYTHAHTHKEHARACTHTNTHIHTCTHTFIHTQTIFMHVSEMNEAEVWPLIIMISDKL